MYTVSTILTMIGFIIILSLICWGVLYAIKTKIKVSSTKIMLLGIGIITFSNAVLKGMIKGDADTTISLIGFSILLSGFFKNDNK